MRKFLSWLTGKNRPAEPAAPAEASVHQRFAIDLYQRLKDLAGPYENILFSPFAVEATLAALDSEADEEERGVHDGLRARLKAGDQRDDYLIRLATGLWGPASLLSGFREPAKAAKAADIDVSEADFSQEEAARTQINQWCASATRNLLPTVAARGELTADTKLVLITMLCFRGFWAQAFDVKRTVQESFWVNTRSRMNALMMWRRGVFAYGQFPFHFADRVQVLAVPFAGAELDFVLLLPEGIEGILELEHTLGRQPGKLADWLGALEPREVEVVIPKFTIGSRFNLHEALTEMGVSGLPLSLALHQTLLAVDETGVEPAAVPAEAAPRRPADVVKRLAPMVRADHPCLFLIWDKVSGQIVLMGRLMQPSVHAGVTIAL